MATVWKIPSRVVQCTAYSTVLGSLGVPLCPHRLCSRSSGLSLKNSSDARVLFLTLSATHEQWNSKHATYFPIPSEYHRACGRAHCWLRKNVGENVWTLKNNLEAVDVSWLLMFSLCPFLCCSGTWMGWIILLTCGMSWTHLGFFTS